MATIELHHLEEKCDSCDCCEDAFRHASRMGPAKHPGVKALAHTFDCFGATEWQYLAVPVHAAVKACKHDALILIERGGGFSAP